MKVSSPHCFILLGEKMLTGRLSPSRCSIGSATSSRYCCLLEAWILDSGFALTTGVSSAEAHTRRHRVAHKLGLTNARKLHLKHRTVVFLQYQTILALLPARLFFLHTCPFLNRDLNALQVLDSGIHSRVVLCDNFRTLLRVSLLDRFL